MSLSAVQIYDFHIFLTGYQQYMTREIAWWQEAGDDLAPFCTFTLH